MRSVPPNARVFVVVVSQQGCPACEDYAPRVAPVAASFVRAGIPTIHINAQSQRAEDQEWMDSHQTAATPTTYVILRELRVPEPVEVGVWKLEGAQDDATVRQVYDFAYSLSVR